METSLIERWLPEPQVLITDDAAVSAARVHVREVGAGLSTELVETMALVTSELLTNQLRHARGGRFAAHRFERDGVVGIEVVAADRGPGLVDPPGALADRSPGSPHKSLGAGLGAVFRLSDEVDVDVRVGEGTCFRVRKLASSPRYRSEIGVFARPYPGEAICGDDAAFVRLGDLSTIAVADGLGHGVAAREASARAMAALGPNSPDDVLREAERVLVGTRGATMAVLRCDRTTGLLAHAGIGDVSVRLEGGGRSSKLAGQSGTIGRGRLAPGRLLRVDEAPFSRGDVVIVVTDGVTSAADAVTAGARHPLLVAHHIVTSFSRAADDALALVARLG
ncbi:MAG: ATP-binding protein [Deltaproteobacteria bacterium]|nr:ATP-binding protein [Deltaproteobacteria bacterium]